MELKKSAKKISMFSFLLFAFIFIPGSPLLAHSDDGDNDREDRESAYNLYERNRDNRDFNSYSYPDEHENAGGIYNDQENHSYGDSNTRQNWNYPQNSGNGNGYYNNYDTGNRSNR